jgi:hypothetical protein
MHRIIPGIGLSGQITLNTLTGGGSAISPEARAVRDAATEVAASTERSMALFGEKAKVLSQLAALAGECAEDGWDGADAVAIDPVAVRSVERFVRVLPEDMPLPELAPDPDGSISLDWLCGRNRLLSLSIGATERLAYAWLDGADKGHAVARFDGQSIPSFVLDAIESIAGRHVGLWAA